MAVHAHDGRIHYRVFHVRIIRQGIKQALETPAFIQSL
jgi:hypothetical protein